MLWLGSGLDWFGLVMVWLCIGWELFVDWFWLGSGRVLVWIGLDWFGLVWIWFGYVLVGNLLWFGYCFGLIVVLVVVWW